MGANFRYTGTERLIDMAFAKDQQLADRLVETLRKDIKLDAIFGDIAGYILSREKNMDHSNSLGPDSKKRKLTEGATGLADPEKLSRIELLTKGDVSLSMPVRKKLDLNIIQCGEGDTKDPSVKYSIEGKVRTAPGSEFQVDLDKYKYAMQLPVPEKAQKQFNFCILPDASAGESLEPLVWTINAADMNKLHFFSATILPMGHEEGKEPGPDNGLFLGTLEFVLKHHNIKLVQPSEDQFVSAVPESHRKGEKTYHVKAHRGSKDGYLFFLDTGIFFGFKKPLAFFALDEIESISYTSVLQRTFNLNISYKPHGADEVQEVEFSMLDQADFAGIDAYIKKHQLQDASMAETRRAKLQKAAGAKAKATNGDAEGTLTELEKAQRQMEEDEVDEEDELEEDYDPEAEDSDGSGSGSDDDDYEYKIPSRNRDLIREELGSEAEDVEITDEEEQGDEEEEEEVEIVAAKPVKSNGVSNPTKETRRAEDAPDFDDELQL